MIMAWKEIRLPVSLVVTVNRLDCLATGWPRLKIRASQSPPRAALHFAREQSLIKCKHESEGNNSCESVTEEKKIMLREMNSVAARKSRRSFRKQTTVAACLLCRVLWPIVVQHRHLLFDCSSEGNTLLLTPKRSPELSVPS